MEATASARKKVTGRSLHYFYQRTVRKEKGLSESQPYQLLPPLSTEEYTALKNSIRIHGVLVPVEFDSEGAILDGHHRLQAVRELWEEEVIRKDYPSIIRAGMSEEEKQTHVLTLNLQRRHLTQVQRRDLIARFVIEAPDKTNRQVAAMLQVSPTTVGAVRDGLEAAGDVSRLDTRKDTRGRSQPSHKSQKPGSASVIARNEKDTHRALVALKGLSAGVLPNHPVDVKLLERIRRETDSAERAKGVENESPILGAADIRLGDFRVILNDITAGSADLILTDPPYAREYLPLWHDLALFAARVLRPGGLLVVYSGQSHLPAVLAHLSAHLQYIWTIAQVGQARKTSVYTLNVWSSWKPILVFSKGRRDPVSWFDDLLIGDGPEKSKHDWQQREDEARRLLEMFSHPGDLVIDPMLGSGTTAVASLALGRRFVGCDISPEAVATSRERVRT